MHLFLAAMKPFPQRSPNSVAHLRRLSRCMVWLSRALMVLLPLGLLGVWAWTPPADLAAQWGLPHDAVKGPVLAWQRVTGAVVAAVPLGLLLAGVWQAQRCFDRFARGKVFTWAAFVLLRRFASFVAAAALAAMAAGALLSVLLTVYNPPGQKVLALAVSSSHVFTVFFAGVVWLMADVIRQGRDIADENRQFV